MCDVRHADNDSSLGREYLVNLLQCKFRVDEVFQNVAAEHRIKVAVHVFNPIRPVEVVDHHLLAPLPGALGGSTAAACSGVGSGSRSSRASWPGVYLSTSPFQQTPPTFRAPSRPSQTR